MRAGKAIWKVVLGGKGRKKCYNYNITYLLLLYAIYNIKYYNLYII